MGFQNTEVTGSVTLSPGSTVTISGTTTVEVSGTPTVSVASGSVEVSVAAGSSLPVTVNGTATVTISGTPTVNIAGTVNANISAGTVQVENVSGGVLVSEATAPQELLATSAGTNTSQTVPLPNNCETIAILLPANYGGTVTVKGASTGRAYPVGEASSIGGGDPLFISNVFPTVDSSVVVTLSVAPGATWYVTSDTVVRYSLGAVKGGGSPLASIAVTDSVMVPLGAGNPPPGITSLSLPLNNVTSGQPLLLAVALEEAVGSVSDTFSTPYTWKYIGAAVVGSTQMNWFIGTGGKGSSGTVNASWATASPASAVCVALAGTSGGSASGFATAAQSTNPFPAPQQVPDVSGQLGVFACCSEIGVTSGGVTSLPSAPFSNLVVPWNTSGTAVSNQLVVTTYPNMQVGTAYQPSWSGDYLVAASFKVAA